jgi:mannosyltransferase OCH1-like enzyme
MAIPKTIYQTYKSSDLPLLTRWHVSKMRRTNPEYDYQFYDDARIETFIGEEYGADVLELYRRINIGAAKADFFRYAILYKRGGVYLDIDSLLVSRLDSFVAPNDRAIISTESDLIHYVQWALVYEAQHPFLRKALEKVIANLRANRFPYDVHQMTGPGAYTLAIKECLREEPLVEYREMGIDYNDAFRYNYPMARLFLYGPAKKNHWKKEGLSKPVIT